MRGTHMLHALPFVAVMLLGGVSASLADVPPPPVNQTLGIFDGSFNDLTEAECRTCHESGLPDRHHLNVGLAIIEGHCEDQPDVTCQTDEQCQNSPTPGGSPNDYCVADSQAPNAPPVPSGNYECLTCHTLVYNEQTMEYEFAPFRDCTLCHAIEFQPDHPDRVQEPTVHHRGAVEAIQSLTCSSCHGSLVDDVFDGHIIPAYDPSLVTPWPSGKPNGGDPANSRGTLAGNCNYCHDSSQPGEVGPILINHDTHHFTGLTGLSLPEGPWGPEGSRGCLLCHPGFGPGGDAFDIRICERCHGIDSLHNIQVDTDGDGIDPGTELAYYGHIGSQEDCWGCHGFSETVRTAAAAPYSGPVVPYIFHADVKVLTAGIGTSVTLSGAAFTNFVQAPEGRVEIRSSGLLTAPDGMETILAPQSVNESEMVVNIPDTLVKGMHYLRAEKADQVSNPAVLAVKPKVRIAAADCTGGRTTISGGGFSGYVDSADSGSRITSVTRGIAEKGVVVEWTDSRIVADFRECGDTVEVHSVFGSTAADLGSEAGWRTASVAGAGKESAAGNTAALLLIPLGIVLVWKRVHRGG